MIPRRLLLVGATSFLVGCSTLIRMPSETTRHPGSPEAVEAQLPPPSETLSIDRSAPLVPPAPIPTAPTVEQSEVPGPEASTPAQPAGKEPSEHLHEAHPSQAGTSVGSQPQTTPRESPTKEETLYTCPMHPEVLSNQPGVCPKCGMKLVKKEKAKP